MEEYINALLVIFIFTFVILGILLFIIWIFPRSKRAIYCALEVGHYFYLTLATIFIGYSISSNNNLPLIIGPLLLVMSVIFKLDLIK
jgi:hypothetical protein